MPVIISGTTGISGTDGSASIPAVQGTDANTGMFFPAADTIAFAEGGTEVMRINASGQVEYTLGTASLPSITATGDTNTGIYFPAADQIAFAEGGTEVMRIDASGNVLIGTSSLGSNVSGIELRSTVGGNAHPRIELNKTFSGTATLVSFQHNKGEIGRITCDNSSTAYVTSSDYRLKHDVQPLANGLTTIAALKPSTYKWNADNSYGEGFIAHELAEHIPLAVSGEKDATNEDGSIKPQGVDYSKVVVHLVAAVQELTAKLEAAEARIATLEAR
jgi:hypothetical protein